jgi:phosphoglycerol transferase MdoB-like AlkP superfamily enzyme
MKENTSWYLGLKALSWRVNIYQALICYLVLAMGMMSLSRMLFIALNFEAFPNLDAGHIIRLLAGGLRFDLTAILYLNSLVILLLLIPFKFRFLSGYKATVRWIFIVVNAIGLALNVIDFFYFKFTDRRTTFDVFNQFENEQNISELLLSFAVDYWYGILIWVFFVGCLVYLTGKIKYSGPQVLHNPAFYLSGIVVIPIAIYLIIGGIRGGFAHSTRPITLSNAGEYVKNPKEVAIVLNTPFALMRTYGKTKFKKEAYFNEQELATIYNPEKHPIDSGFQKKNVVVIILESFSREFFGFYNQDKTNYKGYTPFLDSLLQHSLTFEYTFANGRKSIDGLPSSVASIPSLGIPYFLTPYSNNRINSLGSVLRNEGYHTSFFHGAPNGSMGFQAFMNLAGFEYYYGKTEYNNDADYDGIWGIWDDKFFNFYADKLNEFPKPFMSAIFSVSSHHPFEVPDLYKDKFKGGKEPILKCIEYTDYSLKLFFNKVKKTDWYNNTLFVITADHVSSNVLFDEAYTAWGGYAVPIFFFSPDNSLKSMKEEIAQQIDIMPSVLDYLKYDKPYVAFGRSVFSNEKSFAFNYNNAYQYFEGNHLLIFDGNKSTALYNFKEDKMLKQNLIVKEKGRVSEMERKIKAIIQQYNNRLILNDMVIQ